MKRLTQVTTGQSEGWLTVPDATEKSITLPDSPPMVTALAGLTVSAGSAANHFVMPSTLTVTERSSVPSGFVGFGCVKKWISSPGVSSGSSPTSPGVIARFSQPVLAIVKLNPGTNSWV